ncbi:hypothetical protein D7V64_07190 [Acinetobacter cumulans]|uniref:Uncharacterized protein n=1 Tax=Acinetobacter cumulans TaxID=2136182 RepID=A0A3A8G298_9GAMM|nr:hypothetical protein [Acinetobacter cumulans]RKG53227.1 hypothetical protein D7V64_07190 [Acinetobacter cumulans]
MNLNEKFKKFADQEYESIDDIIDLKFFGKKADYFIFDRSWILEVKFLETERQNSINNYINQLADHDPDFPNFYGKVHVEDLINKHKNPSVIRNQLCDYASRNLKEILRKADKQILATKNVVGNNNCIGILVILNERNDFYDQDFILQEISLLLHRKDEVEGYHRKNVQAIWYIHEYTVEQKKYAFSSFFIGPTANYDSIQSLTTILNLDWISFNGYAFIPSDFLE